MPTQGIRGVIEAINNLDGLTGEDLELAVQAIVDAIEGLELTADVDVTLDTSEIADVVADLEAGLDAIADAINGLELDVNVDLTPVTAAITTQTLAFTAAVGQLGVTLTNELGDLTTAVDGVAAAIQAFTLDSVVTAINDLGAGLSVDIDALAAAIGGLEGNFDSVVTAIEGLSDNVGDLDSTVSNGLYNLQGALYSLGFDLYYGLGDVTQAIYSLNLQGVIDAIDNLAAGELDVNVDDVVFAIQQLADSAYYDNQYLINAINVAAGNIEGSIDGGFAALVSAVTNLPNYTGGLENIADRLEDVNITLQDIESALTEGLGLTADAVEDVVEAITDLPDYTNKLNQIGFSIIAVANQIDNLSGDFTALGTAVGNALGDLTTLLGDESDQTQALISALGSSMADSLANLVVATEEGFGAQALAIGELQVSMEAALSGIEGSIVDLSSDLTTALDSAFGDLISSLNSGLGGISSSVGSVSTSVDNLGDDLGGSFTALVEQLAENQAGLEAAFNNLVEAVQTENTVTIDATGDTYYLDFTDKGLDKVVGFNPLPRRGEGGDELTAYAAGELRNGGLTVRNVQDRKGLKKMMGRDVDLIYRRDKDLLYWNANGDERGLKEITDDGLKLGGRVARIEFDSEAKDKLRAGDFNMVRNPLDVNPGDII